MKGQLLAISQRPGFSARMLESQTEKKVQTEMEATWLLEFRIESNQTVYTGVVWQLCTKVPKP